MSALATHAKIEREGVDSPVTTASDGMISRLPASWPTARLSLSRLGRADASPQSLRWLGARPASAGLCVSGAERRLPARRLADLAPGVGEYGRELTRNERRCAELLEEGRLKRTASTRGRVRVDDADPDPELGLGDLNRQLQIRDLDRARAALRRIGDIRVTWVRQWP